MKSKLLKAVGFLCLTLMLLITGCQPAKTADATGDFTLESLANASSTANVLEKYKSVRMESTYYQPPTDNGEWTSYQYTVVFVKGDNGVAIYNIWDDGYETAIFKDNAYCKFQDGEYGVYACIDGGCYEQCYAPALAGGLIYTQIEGEKLVSSTVENGVRKLVTQSDVTGEAYAASIGITQGVIESVYEVDLKSGLLLRASEYILDGGKKQVLAEGRILYGEDDLFAEPEYVRLCRDMSNARTVHLVQNAGMPDEKTYTATLPKKARLIPETESNFELYTDPAYTIQYKAPPVDEQPDEITLYVKKF